MKEEHAANFADVMAARLDDLLDEKPDATQLHKGAYAIARTVAVMFADPDNQNDAIHGILASLFLTYLEKNTDGLAPRPALIEAVRDGLTQILTTEEK